MQTTIDSAGRIVVPKALREAMGLTGGRVVEMTYADGRLEIEVAPAAVDVDLSATELPVIRPRTALPALADEVIRATIEATRP